MAIFDAAQRELGNRLEEDLNVSSWKNWKWHIKHSIRSLDKFEYVTGIKFSGKKRRELERTFEKFPLSITPYYLSLIEIWC